MKNPLYRLFVALMLLSVLVTACAQPTAEPQTATEAPTEQVAQEPTATKEAMAEPTKAPSEPAGALPMVDPAAVTGDIVAAGSSTVFPLAEAIASQFQDEGYAGNLTIDSIGSGAGFERFCVNGETDIATASRAIKDSEVEACRGIGREPVAFRVGTDALAIVVSAENDFVTDLTFEQLAAIFSGTAATWADVDPSWPAEPIQLFSPGTDSGTFDYFVEVIFEKDDTQILNAPGIQLSEDDNVLVQGVEGSPYAIGYFGYAYYQENQGALKVVSINGVTPSAESVDAAEYPLARPLYLYSDPTILAEKPQVAAFINYFLTYVNDVISEVGYFPASEAVLAESNANWTAAVAGEITVQPTTEPVVEEPTGPESVDGILPGVDPAAVTGDIVAAGSSTVFPLAEAIASQFQDEGYAGNLTIDSIGSGAGFERFCVNGETDIATASRAIKDSEVEACHALSPAREPISFRVGTDALAIVVSAENDFVTDLTFEQLAAIFSGTAATWADVDPTFPAEPIQLFSPGTDSGTFDYFVEVIFAKDDTQILNAPGIQLSEDDNVLVQGVEGSPYAIGYFGYAYYQENQGALKVVSINGVTPSAATVDNNTYPLARPLYLYTDATILAEKPQVAAFINYFLTYVNDVISEVGYFPSSEDGLLSAKVNWLTASGLGVTLPEVDPAAVTGDIVAAGSSTVFPLAEAIASQFQDEGYAGNLTIDSIGSGAGFERFCVNGETDIATASRAIKDSEVEACHALSPAREPISFRVGTDALAIVVSAENDFVTDLTFEQLAAIFSGTAATWADVDPTFPAEPIQLFSPGTDSGTFDYFVEVIFAKDDTQILNAPGIQLSEDDNVLVQGVEGSPYAIGYFGYAYYEENQGALKVVSINGVTPSAATVDNNTYPLARPLYLYTDATILAEKSQVAAFINYFLTHVDELISEVGYFPTTDAALNLSRLKLLLALPQ